MLSEMSASVWYEWLAYAELEPFGEERADLRAGIVASVIANANRAKNRRPYKPGDFMPEFGRRPKKQQSDAEMLALIIELNKSMGGKDERKNRGKAN